MVAPIQQNRQFTFFLGVSVIATAVHYVVMVLLASGIGLPGVTAASAGCAAGGLVSYVLNYRFTFHSTQSHRQTLSRFLCVVLLGFIVNRQIVAACIDWLALHYFPAQVIATVVVFRLNFMLSKIWAFKEPS